MRPLGVVSIERERESLIELNTLARTPIASYVYVRVLVNSPIFLSISLAPISLARNAVPR